MAKNSSEHGRGDQGIKESAEWFKRYTHSIWDYIAPHPTIKSHPVISLLGLVSLGLYWIFGTPISDITVILSNFRTAAVEIWTWALPAPIQSVFLEYPTIHFLAIIVAAGGIIHIRNQGFAHVITEEVVPLIESISTFVGTAIAFTVGGLAGAVVENRGIIKDVVVNVVSSWIFWLLVALGIVSASLSGLVDVLGNLPIP